MQCATVASVHMFLCGSRTAGWKEVPCWLRFCTPLHAFKDSRQASKHVAHQQARSCQQLLGCQSVRRAGHCFHFHLHREQAARKRSGQFKPARQQAPPGEATRVPGCRYLECGTGSVFGKCSLSCSLCLRIDWVRCWSLLRGCRHSQPGLF